MSERAIFCGVCGKILSTNKEHQEYHCGERTISFGPNCNPRYNTKNEYIGFMYDGELYKAHHGRNIVQLFFGQYDNGYTLMVYEDLENDVKDFLRYIPLEYYPNIEGRKSIYSPKLSNLLAIIVSRIDEFFRSWDIVQKKNADKRKEDFKLGDYFAVFNDLYLDTKEVMLINTGEFFKPLERKNNKISWWIARHDVTHDGYNKRDKGNLDNVIMALGALFILNCEHKDVWRQLVRRGYIKNFEKDTFYDIFHPDVTTKLFKYKSSIKLMDHTLRIIE